MPGMHETMGEFKRGNLRSGSGHKVTSRKQAIAIGLNQARKGKRSKRSGRRGRRSARPGHYPGR